MKEVLVLFSFRSHKNGYIEMLFDKLSVAAEKKDLKLYRGSLKDLIITIKDNKMEIIESLTGRSLSSFDVVYFESWYKAMEQALAAALYLERRKKPYLCKELLGIMPVTKVGEIAKMADGDVPLPQTFMSSNREVLRAFKTNPPLSYPLIVKDVEGFGGNNNYLVADYQKLEEILNSNKHMLFVVQEFIPNDRDYRCLVFGGEIKIVLERKRSDGAGHLNNTSQGAEGKVVPISTLSESSISSVLRAAQILGRDQFSGADLMFNKDSGDHYILEVNQTPQIEIGAEVETKTSALLGYISGLAKGNSK